MRGEPGIISIDQRKHWRKSHTLMIKNTQKNRSGQEWECPLRDKGDLWHPPPHTHQQKIHSAKKDLKIFSEIRNKPGQLAFTLTLQHHLGSSAKAIRQERRAKDTQMRKGEVKVSWTIDDMMISIKNPKEYTGTHTLLAAIITFFKVARSEICTNPVCVRIHQERISKGETVTQFQF